MPAPPEAPRAVPLTDRGILAVGGRDRARFLQGLISNDIGKVTAGGAIHAALLTPQGRYLHDFFVVAAGERVLLDGERARQGDLADRLRRYRLRSAVTFDDEGEGLAVAAAWGAGAAEAVGLGGAGAGSVRAFAGGIAFVDPRLAAAGVRLFLPAGSAADSLRDAGFAPGDRSAYDRLRIGLGLADGSRDLEVERSLLVEYGFDAFNGIDWGKGCYVGQEVTARTRYRGLARHRLLPVVVEGPLPPPGTPILAADASAAPAGTAPAGAAAAGEPVGEVRSGVAGLALALLRRDALAAGAADRPMLAGAARLRLVPAAAAAPDDPGPDS